MLVEASIPGLFRTIFIVVGVLVLLRFIGQLMNAKRNMDAERMMNEDKRKAEKEKEEKKQNLGKTNVLNKNGSGSSAEDVDFEEVD
jgi:uncharacterized protein YacL